MFRRFLFSRIWSFAQDHALLDLLLNLVGLFIFSRPRWSCGNDLYHSCQCTTFDGTSRGGQPSNVFTRFIGAGGKWQIWDGKRKTCFSPSRIVTFLPVQKSFVQAGPKCDVFREGCDKKRHKLKQNIFVCESVTFFPEMWQMWLHFCVTEKSDKCDVTPPNLRREGGKKSG